MPAVHPAWRPHLGPRPGTFEMTDLLCYTFGTKAELAPAG